jgi:hypothetical protein
MKRSKEERAYQRELQKLKRKLVRAVHGEITACRLDIKRLTTAELKREVGRI